MKSYTAGLQGLAVSAMAVVAMAALSACGANVSTNKSASLASEPKVWSETIVREDVTVEEVDVGMNQESTAIVEYVSFTAENGGINPEYFAVKIKGNVMLGANSCIARGANAHFVAERVGKDVVITARLAAAADENRICIEIYQPVNAVVEFTVRGLRSETDRIIVQNAENIGAEAILEIK